ncbi:MAG: PAS domain S-box protein, partial [Acidobacteriota bacterium]|nr:PAS domain S-box protein [Acidobacteriota bacterium]
MVETMKPDEVNSSQPPVRVLILEDSLRDAKLIASTLKDKGYRVYYEVTDSPELFRESLEKAEYDLILADFNLHNWNARDAIEILKKSGKDIPLIVVTGSLGDEAAVDCIKLGAADFVLKDRPARLPAAVQRALEEKRLRVENKRAEEAARESSRRLQVLMGNLPGMAYRCRNTPEWPMEFVSEGCLALTGYTPEEMTNHRGTKYGDLIHPEDQAAVYREVQEAVRAGRPFQLEYRITTKDGRLVHVWEQGRLVAGSGLGEQWLEGFITDVTPRKQAEMELRRVNRASRTISLCNEVLVRATEEPHLLEDICGILVREGGYRMAWVGFAENDEGKLVRPVAHAGFEEGYLQTADITWADTERGRGPTGTAIRTGKPVVARNTQTEFHLAPWREEQLKRGYASGIALPIFLNDQVLGGLTIYAKEVDAFDSEEVRLLTELCNDLAYGIQTLRTRAERKQAEEDLRLARFSVDHASDSVIWSDIQSRIIYANEAACRNLGRSLEELLSLTISEIDPLFPKEGWGTYWRTLRTLGTLTFETQCISKLGGVLTLEVTANYQEFNGKGYCFAFGRDITERKQAEQELRLTQFSMEHASDGVFWMDSEGRITRVNEAACHSLERSREELLSLSIPDIDPLCPKETWATIWGKLKSCGSLEFETRHQTKQGRVFPVAIAASYLEFDGKEYSCAIVRDITEHKQAEEALRESERKYRQLHESMMDGFGRGDKDGRLVEVNDAFCKIVGYTPEELS